MTPYHSRNGATLYHGDCLEVMKNLPGNSVDAVVTDPPYGLSFMGKKWDYDIPSVGVWRECLRVLKPAGHLLSFAGSRTHHRMACTIEDAGFEIRDCILWLYGTGFPKGQGNLKPAYEPITLARRPGPKVLPLGIDECRVPCEGPTARPPLSTRKHEGWQRPWNSDSESRAACEARREAAHDARDTLGRYPANILHDGSEEVLEAFTEFGERTSGGRRGGEIRTDAQPSGMMTAGRRMSEHATFGDSGTAARFYYTAKASRSERGEGNNHPTVKPLSLVRWLVRLASPSSGTVLDPFAGSGTTGLACLHEGRNCILVEREQAYCDIAVRRLDEIPSTMFDEVS